MTLISIGCQNYIQDMDKFIPLTALKDIRALFHKSI